MGREEDLRFLFQQAYPKKEKTKGKVKCENIGLILGPEKLKKDPDRSKKSKGCRNN